MRRGARALACAAVLALTGCRTTPEAPAVDDGAFLRELTALPALGSAVRDARLRDNVVLVSFFATWCFPCIAEVPTLQALQREYGAQGLQVVGVGMDLEGARVLEPFVATYELNYPVLVADERMREGQSAFGGIRALPTTFVLDREGRALAAWQGMAPHGALAEAVRKALKR